MRVDEVVAINAAMRLGWRPCLPVGTQFTNVAGLVLEVVDNFTGADGCALMRSQVVEDLDGNSAFFATVITVLSVPVGAPPPDEWPDIGASAPAGWGEGR